MIKSIHIRNFKSLKDCIISLSEVNILYGLNGMGKSTFTQALLLLKQSFNQSLLPNEGLSLNGAIINLGIGKDVFCESGDDREGILFKLVDNEDEVSFLFEYSPDLVNANVLPVKNVTNNKGYDFSYIRYISTNRILPKPFFQTSDYQINKIKTIGKEGEFVAHYLAENYNTKIFPKRKHSKSRTDNLLENLDLWLSEISPSIKINADTDFDANIAKIRYSYVSDAFATNKFKPLNVGFGLTHILPIIVELLISPRKTLLIIENPESHIHPKGQEALSKLITKVANDGVQIIIESHSNEIIEGLVKESTKMEDVSLSLNHFHRSLEEHTTIVDVHENIDDFKTLSRGFHSSTQLRLSQIEKEVKNIRKTLIITEGKTDWKLLKYVLNFLQKEKKEFIDLDIKFFEFEHGDMGETELKKIGKHIGGINSHCKTILLYDRDVNPNCNNSNNVYSCQLPRPKFRKGDKNISIELMFPNTLLHKKCDKNRRLFLTSEFSENGRLKSDSDVSVYNAYSIKKYLEEKNEKIIDGGNNKVTNSKGDSLCLSKNDFCQNILDSKYNLAEYDLSAFKELFTKLKEICNQ